MTQIQQQLLTPADLIFAPHDWASYCKPFAINAARKEMARRELARRDLAHFIRYFKSDVILSKFHLYVCRRLMQFLDDIKAGKDPCMIIEAPPRHGKSMICSDYLPSFALGYLAPTIPSGVQCIHIGYNQEFISEFGGANRNRMLDPKYLNLFPNQEARKDKARTDHVVTIHNDVYHCAGMNSTITGFGAHLLIIDDPIKGIADAQSEVEVKKQIEGYQANISTRGMDKVGKLIMMTRWSNYDIAGYVQEKARQNPEADQWEVLKFPAIATDNDVLGRSPGDPLFPERYSLKRLHRDRAGKSAKVWSAMYQQNPVPESGGFFESADIDKCTVPLSEYPDVSELNMYLSADFAIGEKQKNDWTVLWPFGVDENNVIWFLNDMVRFKGGGNKIIDELMRLGRKYSPKAMILEDGHIYRGFRDFFKERMIKTGNVFYIDAPYPTKDKAARAEPLRALIQNHQVRFPDVAVFKDVVFKEMMAFGEDTMGVHDDTVDAAATGVMRMGHLRAWRRKGSKKSAPSSPDDIKDMNMEQIKQLHAQQMNQKPGHRSLKAKVPLKLNGQTRLTKRRR